MGGLHGLHCRPCGQDIWARSDGMEAEEHVARYHPHCPPLPPEWVTISSPMSGRDEVINVCHRPDGSITYDILVPRNGVLGWLGFRKYETRIDAGERSRVESFYCGSVK